MSGCQNWGSDCQWAWDFFWGDEDVLELDSGDGCTAL